MRTLPYIFVPILACLILIWLRRPANATTALFRILENNKIGYVDKAGRMIIPPGYFNGSDFSEGLAAVRPNGYYGYIDPKGKLVIASQFEWAEPFSDGLALVITFRYHLLNDSSFSNAGKSIPAPLFRDKWIRLVLHLC